MWGGALDGPSAFRFAEVDFGRISGEDNFFDVQSGLAQEIGEASLISYLIFSGYCRTIIADRTINTPGKTAGLGRPWPSSTSMISTNAG